MNKIAMYSILLILQPKTKRVKKVAPAPYTTSKPVPKKVVNPLIEKRPRNFGIGKMITLSNSKTNFMLAYSSLIFVFFVVFISECEG